MRLFNQYKGLKREIYILFICKLIDNMGSMVGPMLTLILSSKLGLNAKEIAVISTIFTIFALPASLIGGKICDKYNKKLILNIGDFTTSILYIICGIIGINKITIFVYYIGSLIQFMESSTYETLIADFSIGEDRDRASSLLYFGLNLGLILSPVLSGFLLENHSNLLFILTGVSQLLSIIVFDICIKDTTALIDTSNKYEDKSDSTSTIEILKQNKIVLYFIVFLALSSSIYNMWSYLIPLSLTKVLSQDSSLLYGTLSSLNCIVVVLFTVPITKLISNLTSINKVTLGNILEILGYFIFVLFINKPFMYYIAIIIFTFGEITNTISANPHITKRIPINYRGRILSFADLMYNIFAAITQFITGYVFDDYGINASWLIVILLDIIATLGYQLIKKSDKNAYPKLYKEKA